MMRRMRDLNGSHLLFAIPVLVVLAGGYFLLSDPEPQRKKGGEKSFWASVAEVFWDPGAQEKKNRVKYRADSSEQTGSDTALLEGSGEKRAISGLNEDGNRSPAAWSGENATSGGKARTICSSVELPGDGPSEAIADKDWEKAEQEFAEAKKGLQAWLDKNRIAFSIEAYTAMQKRLEGVKLQKASAENEPDLTWRGIATYGTAGDGTSYVRAGSGFLKLFSSQPSRAKFELARVVAQSWAPCELAKGAGNPWQPWLTCLNVKEGNACETGSYSEAGWAVSTALAAQVAPPGCTIPAFRAAEQAQCVEKMPTLWKEASL